MFIFIFSCIFLFADDTFIVFKPKEISLRLDYAAYMMEDPIDIHKTNDSEIRKAWSAGLVITLKSFNNSIIKYVTDRYDLDFGDRIWFLLFDDDTGIIGHISVLCEDINRYKVYVYVNRE